MSSPKLIIASTIILIILVCLEFLFIKFQLFGYAPHIGIFLHVLGGCFSGLLLYGIGMDSLIKTPILLQLIFVLGTVAIAAVTWEGFEWALGMALNRRMQGSINNIMLDLFTGMIGGFIACIWVYVLHVKGTRLKDSRNTGIQDPYTIKDYKNTGSVHD